jgi:hypothetical protein
MAKLDQKGYIRTQSPSSPSSPRGFFGRKVVLDRIDYDLIKAWLQTCDQNRCCEAATLLPPGLRFVNCSSRQIVCAPVACQYVALSYVWGAQTREQTSPAMISRLPLPAPQVIEDAIVVTKALDYDYLWIDRYCIDQSNDEEKHTQISNMGEIYMSAALTIIAAGGEDASCGLPGVGPTQRFEQPCVQISERTLLSSLMNPRLEVRHRRGTLVDRPTKRGFFLGDAWSSLLVRSTFNVENYASSRAFRFHQNLTRSVASSVRKWEDTVGFFPTETLRVTH